MNPNKKDYTLKNLKLLNASLEREQQLQGELWLERQLMLFNEELKRDK